jgi:serine/threonine protein kinase
MDAQLLAGRYRLESEIARGAIGVVWRAVDTATGEVVAVKVLKESATASTDYVNGFFGEAEVMRGLDHPAIVRFRDLVAGHGVMALVMELVEGADLHERVQLGGPFAPARAAAIGAEVADALAYIHARGIIHSDVKPGNVLLPDTGPVRLIDFGVARNAAESSAQRLGTPEYVAPEVVAGNRPTPATDVYALGILLYELVTGRTPFRGGASAEVMARHVGCVALPPPGLPAPLWATIDACLRPDPATRPAPGELAARLRAVAAAVDNIPPLDFLAPDVATFRPRGAAVRSRALGRARVRVLAATALLATLLLTGGAALANGVFDGDRAPGGVANSGPSAPAPSAPAPSAPAPSMEPPAGADDQDEEPDDAASTDPAPTRRATIGGRMPRVDFPRR